MISDYEALVQHESRCCECSSGSDEDILKSNDLSPFREDYTNHNVRDGSVCTYTESLECDVIYSAPPLDELYKYHIFFSHSSEDEAWVMDLVAKLENEPYNYKCFYTSIRNKTKGLLSQNSMCAAMLSERVVVVLTRHYVKSTWFEYQDILQNFTQCSLYRQRIICVLLRDCEIPDSVVSLGFLDARVDDFFKCFVRHLRSGNCYLFFILKHMPYSFYSKLTIVCSTVSFK